MSTISPDPYRPPEAELALTTSSLEERLKCPKCQNQALPYWKAYCKCGFTIHCTGCKEKLALGKDAYGRWSTFAIATPAGILGAAAILKTMDSDFELLLGSFGAFITLPCFFVALVVVTIIDYYGDKLYIRVKSKSPDVEPAEEAPQALTTSE